MFQSALEDREHLLLFKTRGNPNTTTGSNRGPSAAATTDGCRGWMQHQFCDNDMEILTVTGTKRTLGPSVVVAPQINASSDISDGCLIPIDQRVHQGATKFYQSFPNQKSK